MAVIRSPLGALGALMILIDGVIVGGLAAVEDADLQTVLVWLLVGVTVTLVAAILFLIGYLAKKNPSYLYSPSDIDSSVHMDLYGGSKSPPMHLPDADLPVKAERPKESDNTLLWLAGLALLASSDRSDD